MRKEITIAAEPRELRGKNEARRLRAKGSAPAVLYGAGGDAVAVAINPKEINRILHSKTGHNTIFDIAVRGGETTPVMIVDWQNDPIKENILHIDLKRIDIHQTRLDLAQQVVNIASVELADGFVQAWRGADGKLHPRTFRCGFWVSPSGG